VQPTWKDDVYRNSTGDIEVSGFLFVHEPDIDNDGAYERKALNAALDAMDELNDAFFAKENENAPRKV
jgi:hypothetical protein